MLVYTCCHLPPVQFSAGQDRIQLKYTNLDGSELDQAEWAWGDQESWKVKE